MEKPTTDGAGILVTLMYFYVASMMEHLEILILTGQHR